MNSISQFEDFIENFMEGSLTRLFKSDLQPVEIAKRLGRSMEADQRVSIGRILVPNFYAVHLNPEDFKLFQNYQGSLERELSNYLSRLAKERRFFFPTRHAVKFISDESVGRREVRITTSFTDEATPDDSSTEETSALAGMTTKLVKHSKQSKMNMSARLIKVSADGTEREFLISKLPFNIGRALDNDLILEETGVSRYHAQIRDVFEKLCIVDMKSTNGTRVNGDIITQVILKDGDQLTLAEANLTFRLQSAS